VREVAFSAPDKTGLIEYEATKVHQQQATHAA
jgi:hypothetical protein